jgi:hypothetical protein
MLNELSHKAFDRFLLITLSLAGLGWILYVLWK